jgi:hypothetical protein
MKHEKEWMALCCHIPGNGKGRPLGDGFMDKRKKLDNIANGFYAAGKIRDVYQSNLRSDNTAAVRASSTDLLGQILNIITQYSPEKHQEPLKRTLQKSSTYIETYKSLKQHMKTPESRSMSRHNFVHTLMLMSPILSNRRQLMVEKVLKLYELFD